MDFSAPEQCGLSKAEVDHLAAKVAEHLNYQPGQDLDPIVTKLGGIIRIQDILDFNAVPSGSIRVQGMNRFEIFLASHTGPTRDRFTIAHELGHYFLHYVYPNQTGRPVQHLEAQRYGSGRVEWEANWFAAGFLMPANLFRDHFKKLGGSITLTAAEFAVSIEAARIRSQVLGLS